VVEGHTLLTVTEDLTASLNVDLSLIVDLTEGVKMNLGMLL